MYKYTFIYHLCAVNIFIDSHIIYMYTMYTSGTPKRADRPVCTSLGPSDEVHQWTTRHDKEARTHTHSLFLITREEKKNEHSMLLRYSREGIEKKKKNMGAGIRTCSWAALPKTLHPLSTGTSSDWRTHKQNHNCEAKRNEQTSEKKNTNFLRVKEHRFLTLLENR